MNLPKILVTAAAGKTGFATSMQLLEKGFPVRAFVRHADSRSEILQRHGAEIVTGTLDDIADVRRALDGVQRAYFCPPWSPNALAASITFAIAAQEKKLKVVAVMSQWLADPSNPSTHTRETWLADKVFSWMPNVDTITINPGWFADNYMSSLGLIAQLGMMVMPLGQGLNAPPSNEDIARVIVGALTNPASHIGKTYRPTGPRLLSPDEIAATVGQVLGRKVIYRNAPIKLFSQVARALGYPDFQIAQVSRYFEEYQRNAFGIGAPTDAVLQVSGQPPEDFATIVRRYVVASPNMKPSLGGQLGAITLLTRAMVTPALDLDSYARAKELPHLPHVSLAVDSAEWQAIHDWIEATNRPTTLKAQTADSLAAVPS